MKVSLSWIKEYIPVDLGPDEIASKLTMAGLEVDAVENLYAYLDGIVVARVMDVKKHPKADKLTCCTVDTGRDETVQIVCGAPNVRQGMLSACALPGAVLPKDLKIKKSKLRGEVSEGMLCSAAELMLDADAAGIMDIAGDYEPGTPLGQALNISDTVFEIDLTPNRPDCLSVMGVAREMGAFTRPGRKITKPDITFPLQRTSSQSIHDHARVEIKDPDLCPRYSAGLLFDVAVGPSPFWLRQRLESVGLTPINNVVDVTNFVMMETGQPLHAFDYDNLSNGRIVVQKAGSTSEFTTLDSKVHKLEPEMLMICDGHRPVALAGVMGGENSEISHGTTRVLIESACFNPISIRRTAKRTGIATDASHRFERGVDPLGTVYAMQRAMTLIAEICDATIARDIIDAYPLPAAPVRINLDARALNVRLGTDFSTDEITDILTSVEFGVQPSRDGYMAVNVPSFRVDVARPEDLSEEVARLWGYNRIQTTYPAVPAKGRPLDPVISARSAIRHILTGLSFYEAINYNFISRDFCDHLLLSESDPRRKVVQIVNPLSDQMSVLRTSLIPGLLANMRKNTSQQTDTLHLFEIGKTFLSTGEDTLPEESEIVAGLITGNRTHQTWYGKKQPLDFFDLKGVVEDLLDALGIADAEYAAAGAGSCPYFESGHGAKVTKDNIVLGFLGKVATPVLQHFGLKQDAYVFELDLAVVMGQMPRQIKALPLPRFPSISQDITLIVDHQVPVGDVFGQMKAIAGKNELVEDMFLFDLFEGSPLAEGKKSLSFRIVYRSDVKTLTEKNIRKLHAGISSRLVEVFHADLPE
ncbi:MAG: phenylalanine--tRNA ligase subunit beta [Desulfotignum sp.]|nr:phenylalanine--tRNA ligase subunit beta [Desulfobacteraceae bacterium]